MYMNTFKLVPKWNNVAKNKNMKKQVKTINQREATVLFTPNWLERLIGRKEKERTFFHTSLIYGRTRTWVWYDKNTGKRERGLAFIDDYLRAKDPTQCVEFSLYSYYL